MCSDSVKERFRLTRRFALPVWIMTGINDILNATWYNSIIIPIMAKKQNIPIKALITAYLFLAGGVLGLILTERMCSRKVIKMRFFYSASAFNPS